MSDDGKSWRAILKDQVKAVAIAFAVFGLLLMALWWATNDGSSMSMFLLLAGIGIISLAIMLYFFTPSRYLRDEVSDAAAISSVLSLNRVLSSMLVGTGGITSANGGLFRVFIPISRVEEKNISGLSPGVEVFDVKGPVKGISLVPLGYGLYQLASSMGAVFTQEGLESEIKDVVENGMEMVSSVSVRRDGDFMAITMAGMVNEGMCRSIRASDPDVCTRTGCPVCSFLACMAASGTGRKVRIEKVEGSDKALNITLRLL
ncbi:MAG TPA: hypothetical protein VMC84_03440 [Methanocella sp.]|uniref:hypothetical protein n=1 Tax=Methanocella sp. TaxID=2052833 RepID=UPI002CB07B95|nr:hypothetical protein [Methanocella sp.]HTY90207.1 hypothetical protein [Methanocella sp.]